MLKKIILFTFLFFYKTLIFSQLSLAGIVVDEKNEQLPFVHILINENQKDGVSTDIDGKFLIKSNTPIRTLTLSFIGFEKLIYKVQEEDFGKNVKLQLRVSTYSLREAVVIAGENPAHRIIRKVVKNRDQNNPEKMQSFQCKTYNKLTVDFLPNKKDIQEFQDKNRDSKKKRKKKQVENFDGLLRDAELFHVMIMESVTERKFSFPRKNSEHVIHNQVSGFKDPSFVALANDFQPFSFYGNHIEILEKAYLNPISPNSTRKYFFNIVDTLLQKTDSVFVITYHPKKGKNFEGLKGVLFINTNGYALQNVIAEPNDDSFIKMKLEQRYTKVEDQQWFPEQLNFVFEATKYPNKLIGSRITGKSYIREVILNPTLSKKDFKNQGYTTAENANVRADSIWEKYRPEELSLKDEKTYEVIDSIGEEKNFDKMLLLVEALASGRLPYKKIDFLVHKLLSFNEFEEVRLGGGLATNDRLSRFFEIGGYAGYGFKDKKWKYGSYLLFDFLPEEKLQLKFNFQKEIHEPATLQLTNEPQLFSRRIYATRMDDWQDMSAHLRGKIGKAIRFNFSLGQSIWQPQYEYQFDGENNSFQKYYFTEAGLNLRIAFSEKIIKSIGTEISETRFPLLFFSYKKGLDNVGKGNFDYHKLAFSVEDDFRIRGFGETSFRLEAGMVDGKVPYTKLHANSGIGRGFRIFEIADVFQTMDLYEFLSDRFVHFFFEHNFGTLLFKYKNFKPEISLAQNIGWGSLQNPNLHQGIEVKTMEKGFFESGFRVDNLLRFNYVNLMYLGLGGGIYYRFGDYAFSDQKENFAYRVRVKFSF